MEQRKSGNVRKNYGANMEYLIWGSGEAQEIDFCIWQPQILFSAVQSPLSTTTMDLHPTKQIWNHLKSKQQQNGLG